MRVEQVSIRKKQQTNGIDVNYKLTCIMGFVVPGTSQEWQNITDDTTSSDKS